MINKVNPDWLEIDISEYMKPISFRDEVQKLVDDFIKESDEKID